MNLTKACFFFTLLIFSLAFLTGCKNDSAKPKPSGSIKAVVSPAGAVAKMQLVKSGVTMEIHPENGDTFLAENLEDGLYRISFWPAKYFTGPSYFPAVTVAKGEAVNLDTIVFVMQDTVRPGTMSATMNDLDWTFYQNSAKWINDTLFITGEGYTKDYNTGMRGIAIGLIKVTGPGIFNAPSFAGVGYSIYAPQDLIYSTNVLGGNMTVNLTKFDPINNRISGEFTFLALPVPGSGMGNTRRVTNGIFTDVRIK